jgi:hypothetical protein
MEVQVEMMQEIILEEEEVQEVSVELALVLVVLVF